MNRSHQLAARSGLAFLAVLVAVPVQGQPPGKGAARAIPAPEKLLPAATQFFIASPDFGAVQDGFKETQFGRLYNDPLVQEFREDLEKKALKGNGLSFLGIPFTGVRDVTRGPAAWATVGLGGGRLGHLLILEVNGKRKQLDRVLAIRSNFWKADGGSERTRAFNGDTLTLMEKPNGSGGSTFRAHVIKDDLFVASDSATLVEDVLRRWAKPDGQSLAGAPAFTAVIGRARPAEANAAQIRFFVDLQAVSSRRRAASGTPRKKDRSAQLRKAGLNGFKAIGGYVCLNTRKHDLEVHLALYAPRPHERGMKVVQLINGKDFPLPDWVQPSVSTVTQVNLDLVKSLGGLAPIYDEVVAGGEEGTFEETLEDLKKDPQIKLDVRKDLIGQVGNPVLVVTDTTLPVSKNSNRFILAVPVKDRKKVESALYRFYRGDDRVRSRRFRGRFTIYEVGGNSGDADSGKESLSVPAHAVTVSARYLYLTTNVALLESTLRREQDVKPGAGLADQEEFKQFLKAAAALGNQPAAARQFSLLRNDLRVVYEMTRQNQLEDASSVYGQLLLSLLRTSGVKLRGSLLPEFSRVERHLGTLGSVTRNTPDGWEILGFCPRRRAAKGGE